jgi:hypothetical protein
VLVWHTIEVFISTEAPRDSYTRRTGGAEAKNGIAIDASWIVYPGYHALPG